MTDAPERIWAFERYVNGILMAEGVEITKAASLEEAAAIAARLAPRGPNGEAPVLVFTPEALAKPPAVIALVKEAEARGMERAADIIGNSVWGSEAAKVVRQQAAAIREVTP